MKKLLSILIALFIAATAQAQSVYNSVHPAVYPAVHSVDSVPWGYVEYNFYVDFTRSPIDRVSGQLIQTVLSAGRYDYLGNSYGENEPVIEPGKGLLGYGSYTQLVPYSENTAEWTGAGPYTQSINLTATGVYTVSTDLSGATITITAGTATLDGGASATYGNPDQFEVTGVGTITISSDTANPKAQITKTPYKLPYAVNATAGTVTVSQNYADADEGGKFPINDMPKLLDALGGVADGVELIVDGDGESITGWTGDRGTISSVSGGIVGNCLRVENTATYGRSKQSFSTAVGERYKVTVWFKRGDNDKGYAHIGSSDGAIDYYSSGLLSDADWTEYTGEFTATGTTAWLRIYGNSSDTATGYSLYDQISVKKISPAQGKMVLKWRPMFDAADLSADVNIITANDEATSFLFWDQSENKLSLHDGTNTATVDCTPVSGTLYTIVADYDDSTGMRLTLDGSAGSIETFAGSFPNDSHLSYGWDAEAPQYIKLSSIAKEPSW